MRRDRVVPAYKRRRLARAQGAAITPTRVDVIEPHAFAAAMRVVTEQTKREMLALLARDRVVQHAA